MARAALRELLDSIYFFWSQMKAAQAVITPKPMPKAKQDAHQGRGPWPWGLEEFEAKPDGTGGQHQHLWVRVKLEQWCLGLHYFMFFPGVSVLQMLVLLLFFLEPCRWHIRAHAIVGHPPGSSWSRPAPSATSPPAGDVVTPGPILQELSDTTDEEGKGKIKGKGHGKGDGKREGQSKDSEP